jgi:ubiquinone/menaquinone biosynthesis C-methylase UbiE
MTFATWRERKLANELMDTSDPADARRSLRDLVRINALLGGHRIVRQLLARAGCRDQPFSLLDVGAASGDSSRIIRKAFPSAHVVSLDQNATNLAAAPRPKAIADAFHLPFASNSFDYVFCSSFLHHFDNDQVVRLLQNFARVARRAVLLVEMERHFVPYWFMRLTHPLFRWHWLTVHDGLLSVRAAFTSGELRRLAETAGLRRPQVKTHRSAFRISVMAQRDACGAGVLSRRAK